MSDASLTWEQVRRWRVRLQHLDTRLPASKTALPEIAATLGGLHAQVMSSAELSAWNRVDGFVPADLAQALWQDRTLVKLWAQRGTLHLHASGEYPLWQAALGTYDNFLKGAWTKASGISPTEIERLITQIAEALDGKELTRDQLADRVVEITGTASLGDKMRGSWGSLLKPASYRGALCSGPGDGQRVRFANPEHWLSGRTTPWGGTPDEAWAAVVTRYLHAYGPAERDEIGRWAALTPAKVKKIIAGLGDTVATVEVDGESRLALADDVAGMRKAKATKSVRLLPAFDPYVVGATRHARHLMSPTAAARDEVDKSGRPARIYRDQGWLTAVLLVDGRFDGTWRFERKGKKLVVDVEPFEKLPASVTKAVTGEADGVAKCFDAILDLTIAPPR